jgi:predicted nucleotidyltransferase
MGKLTATRLNALLRELRRGLETAFAERLEGMYLFGSYCRGEADDESDVDILIVLSEMRAYGKEVDASSELVAGLSLEYGVAITPVFVPVAVWREGRGFFVASIREEAIAA